MILRRRIPILLLTSAVLWLAPAAAEETAGARDDVLQAALTDELARSVERLALGEQPRPYFVSYRVDDAYLVDAAATLGSLVMSYESRNRYLLAEVRVGSPEFDNTNYFTFPGGDSGVARSFRGRLQVPLDDDYRELRRQAWLLTDGAYKRALDHLSRKKAALRNRQRSVELPDFSAVEPRTVVVTGTRPAVEQKEIEDLVRTLSAALREFPSLRRSEVQLQTSFVDTRFLDSEGSAFHRGEPLVRLSAWAERQAPDGRPLADALSYYGRQLQDLPSVAEMTAEVRALGERLDRAAEGDLVERYNGPVLMTPTAAAELVLQGLAPRLVGFRRPVAEDPRLEESLEQLDGGFNDRLGGRVLARFLRLVDDPTRREHDGVPLVGGFAVDDEGVAATPTVLVERGILKRLLTSRKPTPGMESSTGSRRGPGASPSNLLLEADDTRTRVELESELLALAAERDLTYGIVIERIANEALVGARRRDRRGSSGRGEEVAGIVVAYRLYPDGRREPLRNLEIVGLGSASFKDIVAAGDDAAAYSAPLTAGDRVARILGAGDVAPLAVSVVTPTLLFEELTIKSPDDPVPNPPVVPSPLAAHASR